MYVKNVSNKKKRIKKKINKNEANRTCLIKQIDFES